MNKWYIRNGKVLMNSNGKLRGCCCDTGDCSWLAFGLHTYGGTKGWIREGSNCPAGTMHFELRLRHYDSEYKSYSACGYSVALIGGDDGTFFNWYAIFVPEGCNKIESNAPNPYAQGNRVYIELNSWYFNEA